MLFTQEERPLDIIPVGRIAIDFNPTDMNRPLSQSEHFNKYLGGSPANIAVGMARLGRKVGFLARISDDAFGDFVEGFFRNEGIDVSHVKRCVNGEKLGLTFTEILSPTQSSILMYREGVADLMLHPDDVDEAYVASSKSLLISGTSLCCSPTREAALKALTFAQRHDVTVIFDADYRAYTWKNKDEISIYTSLVAQKSDIILGSREEFDLMERLLGLDGTDKASAAYWLGQGAKLLVIKHGKEGSMAYTAEELEGEALPCGGHEGLWRRRRLRFRMPAWADDRPQPAGSVGDGQRLCRHAGGEPCLLQGYAQPGCAGGVHPGGEGAIRYHGQPHLKKRSAWRYI